MGRPAIQSSGGNLQRLLMSIDKIIANGEDYTIPVQKYKLKLRKNTGDDSLDYDDVDNNFEILRQVANKLIDANAALEARVKTLEGS